MGSFGLVSYLIIFVFILGYAAIIFEHVLKVSKSAIALLIAVLCWAVYLVTSDRPLSYDLGQLGHHASSVSQIIFFLMAAMALVELIDAHKGFKIITDFIHSASKKRLLWTIALLTFFLSAMLDNLTTTILMISLLRKLIREIGRAHV